MDVFDILTLIGGISLFLFGMDIMGQALERRAGGKLRSLLGKFTTNKIAGLLTGLGVTAIIQSSSATTVMVVGFANSGLMTLTQAVNVIMGANIGTTVTAWILSLAGIESSNVLVRLLKPSSFTPILALTGIIFYLFCKNDRNHIPQLHIFHINRHVLKKIQFRMIVKEAYISKASYFIKHLLHSFIRCLNSDSCCLIIHLFLRISNTAYEKQHHSKQQQRIALHALFVVLFLHKK